MGWPFGTRMEAEAKASAIYWRNAYETLVKQTGRDLNDGLGLDPRRVVRPTAQAGWQDGSPNRADLDAEREKRT